MDQQVGKQLKSGASQQTADERFIRLQEVMTICGKSRTSIYEAMNKGDFPRAVKLGGRSTAWVKSEIDAWIQQCIQARPPARQ